MNTIREVFIVGRRKKPGDAPYCHLIRQTNTIVLHTKMTHVAFRVFRLFQFLLGLSIGTLDIVSAQFLIGIQYGRIPPFGAFAAHPIFAIIAAVFHLIGICILPTTPMRLNFNMGGDILLGLCILVISAIKAILQGTGILGCSGGEDKEYSICTILIASFGLG